VKILEERVAQLEQEQTLPFSQLSREIKSVVVPVNAAYHGPDTPSHFEDFSIDAVVAEFSCLAPNVYHLLKSLGNCEAGDDAVATNEVKVVTCMSILLKCHSYRVLGVQHLLTLMLLARATSR